MTTFGAEFISAAPAEWKRTAQRTGVAARTLRGLFRTDPVELPGTFGMRVADQAPRFEVASDEAQAFGLAVRDRLMIDGAEYSVVEMVPNDCGTITATLRRFG